MAPRENADILTWVISRAVEEGDPGVLALAAFDGPAAVTAYLDGHTRAPISGVSASPTEHPPTWLKSLTVTAFRGVGPTTTLYFPAGPGLTVVSGRNGSGKSSLAEGLEVALTGRTYRWGNDRTSTQFDPAWRNLHTNAEPNISLRLTRDDQDCTIDVAWAPGATDKAALTRSVESVGQTADFSSLGWDSAIEVFRPMLSYEELGQSLLKANQKTTAQAFERGLGLQQLTAAAEALNTVAKQTDGATGDEKNARAALRELLEASGDERAAALRDALPKRITPTADVGAFRSLDTTAPVAGGVAVLTQIADVRAPSADDVTARTQRLRAAADAYAAVTDRAETLDQHRQDLLRRALDLHAVLGDDPACPVCGTGVLDADWLASTRETLDSSASAAHELSEAENELRAARTALEGLVGGRPGQLSQTAVDLTAQQPARDAWATWAQLPADHAEAAHHVETHLDSVRTATEAWRAEAEAEALRRRDDWAPVAQAVLRWLDAFDRYCDEFDRRARITAAQKLLRTTTAEARELQLAPIREKAQAMWAQLRHESNVSLGDLKLSATKLEIPAEVDGAQAGALQVMSQGELHALALALFLPRAASDASPFRFVVLDDPVQAMDPAKVEGLLSVLLDLAQTRQVVVFSHDDRLAAAARRRMGDPTASIRLLTVERGGKSAVTIKPSGDAAGRYLSEAGALLKDKKVNPALKSKVASGLFRMAIEAAARDAWFRNGLGGGLSPEAVEERWEKAKRTKDRVALAAGVDDCFQWFSWDHPHRKPAIEACNEGMHSGQSPDALEKVFSDVHQTVKDLRKSDG
ncbi:ATP-binding protein [Mariniluteicoccus endophyticus]